MNIWLQQKYANILCSNYRNFKVKKNSPYLSNFSCEICGDSQINKRKARAYIGEKKNSLFYYCHNCNVSFSFESYLYHQDSNLFKQYSFEKYKETEAQKPVFLEDKPIQFIDTAPKTVLSDLEKLSDLNWTHPAKKYVVKRQIPLSYHFKLRYSPHFTKFVNSLISNKLNENNKEGRLIIPFFDENGLCFGFQGRNFSDNKTLRYITIMLTDKKPKIFGLDTVDWNKTVYVTEGPIDSMFIDNAIAICGSEASVEYLKGKNVVFVYDNEKRNKSIIKNMEKAIDCGHRISIFPENIKEKDINDMIMSGKSSLDIKKIIDDNTVHGLKAKVKLLSWRKC